MKITKATIVEYRRNMEKRWKDKDYYGLAFTPEHEAINWAIYNCPKTASVEELVSEANNYLNQAVEC